MLLQVLTPEEAAAVDAKVVGAPQFAIDLLEQKILAAADRWLAGGTVADLTLAEGLRLANLAAEAQRVMAPDKRTE